MDNKQLWIIGGGVLVGVVLLASRSSGGGSRVADIAIAQINANAQQRAAAISAQPAVESAIAQREQVRLAAGNEFYKTRYDFLGLTAQNSTARQGQFFAFGSNAQKMAYADSADKRANATQRYEIDAKKELASKQAELQAWTNINRDSANAFAKVFSF